MIGGVKMKNLAWDFFARTGNVNFYLAYKEFEKITGGKNTNSFHKVEFKKNSDFEVIK